MIVVSVNNADNIITHRIGNLFLLRVLLCTFSVFSAGCIFGGVFVLLAKAGRRRMVEEEEKVAEKDNRMITLGNDGSQAEQSMWDVQTQRGSRN